MRVIFRQLASLILPITALVLVPLWIQPDWHAAASPQFAGGLVLMLAGLVVMAVTVASFIRIGRGTLAPWSPTSRLVIVGMYAYVRNPMILGVLGVLLGEALAFNSCRILAWALAFFAINTLYFHFLEEPGLEKRFGEEYRRYKQHVPRWIPRFTAYSDRSRGD
jgi:protein-S-isoprenylcysteine O-methyltransferase Ste14